MRLGDPEGEAGGIWTLLLAIAGLFVSGLALLCSMRLRALCFKGAKLMDVVMTVVEDVCVGATHVTTTDDAIFLNFL